MTEPTQEQTKEFWEAQFFLDYPIHYKEEAEADVAFIEHGWLPKPEYERRIAEASHEAYNAGYDKASADSTANLSKAISEAKAEVARKLAFYELHGEKEI